MKAVEMASAEARVNPVRFSETELASALHAVGIGKGDCLFIHAGLRNLGKFVSRQGSAGPEALLEAFIDVVGMEGTLVVPTFNFGFCQGQPFDRQNTPGDRMGALSESLRRHPSALRSQHPFQPVAAIGAAAAEIAEAQGRSAFSQGSAFDVMLKRNCKILFLGVDFVETFVHVAEERANVPYRFWKTFTGDVIDRGISERVSVDFFARNLELVPEPRIDNDKLGRDLRDCKIIASSPLSAGRIAVCDARDLVDHLTEKLRDDPSYALKQELG